MNKKNIIRHKNDDTYIVKMNGYDFHVTPDYPTKDQYGEEYTYEAIKAYAKTHPDEVIEYIEPEPQPTPEELKHIRLISLEAGAQKLLPTIQAGIDAETNQQKLVDIMLEIEELKGNL